jgi:hypothetical protein
VLVIDGLDEARCPQRMAADVERLSHSLLDDWKLVVASRPVPNVELRRFDLFDILQLGRLTEAEMTAILREFTPDLTEETFRTVVGLADGNPLSLRLLTQNPEALGRGGRYRLEGSVEQAIANALRGCRDQAMLMALMEELALAGGQDRISVLAGKLQIPQDQVGELLSPEPPIELV